MNREARSLMEVAVGCARAGLAVLAAQRTPEGLVEKGLGDYQTGADVAVERAVIAALRALRPSDAIVGEELGEIAGDAAITWYVDPLDGTRNFVQGRPEIAISIGVVVDGEPRAGAIALPFERREGIVIAGAIDVGVEIDGAPHRRPSRPPGVRDPLIGLPSRGLRDLLPLLGAARDVSVRASGALAYDLGILALGRLDARFGGHFRPWDVIAGAAIVRAAGGEIFDGQGRRWALGAPALIAVGSLAIVDELRAAGMFPGAPAA